MHHVDLQTKASEVGRKLREYRDSGDKIANVDQDHIEFVKAMIAFKRESNDVTMSLPDLVSFLHKLEGV